MTGVYIVQHIQLDRLESVFLETGDVAYSVISRTAKWDGDVDDVSGDR